MPVLLARLLAVVACLCVTVTATEARRVALVIGQGSYATFSELDNPPHDARRFSALLARNGFEFITCNPRGGACVDLDRAGLERALKRLETAAKGAELALVYFAGHGLSTNQANVLIPVDARPNCRTGSIMGAMPVERVIAAVEGARSKIVVLDSCRDNPIGQYCPALKSVRESFSRIEPGAHDGLLVVTSTQRGQKALDGEAGGHSPFAQAFLATLEAYPTLYFEQVMNEVARTTFEMAKKDYAFLQIPGKTVGGSAPADCLAGTGCIGDARIASLTVENARLAEEAAITRGFIAEEERRIGKPLSPEARKDVFDRLGVSLRVIESVLSRITQPTAPGP